MIVDRSFDDGTETDSNVLQIIYDRGLVPYTTFYLPTKSWGFQNYNLYKTIGVEVGGHTVNHPMDLKLLSTEDLQYEIKENKENLEDKFHYEITKFCFPRGRYNDEVVRVCTEAGYTYMRTTKVLFEFDIDPACLIKGTTLHFYNRKEYNGKDWLDMANEIIDKEPEVFRCWGHSKEILEQDGSFAKLDKLLKRLSIYVNS